MKVKRLLVADYATVDQAGKLSVFGIFSRIYAHSFPARHRLMYLITTLDVELGESGDTRTLTIKFTDPDGQEVWVYTQNFETPKPEEGRQPEVNILLELRDFLFPKAGGYDFNVYIDKDFKEHLPIDVELIPEHKG